MFRRDLQAIDWGGSAHRGCPRTGGNSYDTEYQAEERDPEPVHDLASRRVDGRHVEVTERRTAVDFAHQMRWLVD